MIDQQTALVFGLQILALFTIAGALIVYLFVKISTPKNVPTTLTGAKPSILITSVNNQIGEQLANYLASLNFRVFAGNSCLVVDDHHQSNKTTSDQRFRNPDIIEIPLNVNREDVLHEAVDLIRSHLPAGEDGLWAIINTGYDQNRLLTNWETVFRTNVLGILRLARVFSNLLRIGHGRLISINWQNKTHDQTPNVVQHATNSAIYGVCDAIRNDFQHFGIKVINLSLPYDLCFRNTVNLNATLPEELLTAVNESLTSLSPKKNYTISKSSCNAGNNNFIFSSLKVF